MCHYTSPTHSKVFSSLSIISNFQSIKVLVVLKNVQVMVNAIMGLVFVMNLVDGEDLCVKYRDAQG